jgi:hypothetical protein
MESLMRLGQDLLKGGVVCGLLKQRAVRRKPRLAWDALVELYGDETILRQCIEALKATSPDNIGDLLELADKCLGGWRPKELPNSGMQPTREKPRAADAER